MAEIHHFSKQDQLIEMLTRPEGVTIAQAIQATGWQAHTVRGTISGVLKRKLGLEVLTGRDASGVTIYSLEPSQVALVKQSLSAASARRLANSYTQQRKYAVIQVPDPTKIAVLADTSAINAGPELGFRPIKEIGFTTG